MDSKIIIFWLAFMVLNFLCLCAVIFLIYNRTFPPYKPNRPKKNYPKENLLSNLQSTIIKNEPKFKPIVKTDQELFDEYRRNHSSSIGH